MFEFFLTREERLVELQSPPDVLPDLMLGVNSEVKFFAFSCSTFLDEHIQAC